LRPPRGSRSFGGLQVEECCLVVLVCALCCYFWSSQVVPGYYLRRAVDGTVEGSTCCNNTASEHLMVERLIVDDMLVWATQYKVAGHPLPPSTR